MPQIIKTAHYGDLEFEKSWANENRHIGKLVNGGYCFISGQPILYRNDIERTIPTGKDLEDALLWFENKDSYEAMAKRRCIVIMPDGSFSFDDGSPVTSYSDIVNNLPQGELQDAALRWWAMRDREKKELEEDKESIVGKLAEKVHEKFESKIGKSSKIEK